jgi:hypothetical protein
MALAADSEHSIRLSNERRNPRWRCGFKTAITAFLLCLSPATLLAETNAAPLAPASSNRYLFIVETSRQMRPRAHGVFETMKQALDSSLKGQIHQGDFVGIWTFNENVYQDLFPSQRWSQATQLAFAVRLQMLANPDIYLKRGRLEKVVPEMTKVISENENVTIVFVSSGEGVMQGTPFSAQINSAWKEWHDELEGTHMPLLTALLARKGQHTDWLFTPAPRPIVLSELADSKPDDEKETNPAGVILESGIVEKKPAPATIVPEQQVAFSVWALGKTGFVASAKSPQNTPPPNADASTSPAPPPTNFVPVSQPSAIQATNNAPSKPATADIPSPEPAKPTHAPSESAEAQRAQIADNTPVNAPSSKSPLTEVQKPVELAFVTNTPVNIATVPEPPARTVKSAEAPSPMQVAATEPKDITANPQFLAHALTTEEEKRLLDPASPAPRRSFLRENINPLVLMLAAAFGAAYCFRLWFLTNTRVKGNAMSLTHSSKTEAPGEMVRASGGKAATT